MLDEAEVDDDDEDDEEEEEGFQDSMYHVYDGQRPLLLFIYIHIIFS